MEKLNGATGLLMIILACIVTFGTKSMIYHALFALWLGSCLCFFTGFERGIAGLLVYGFSFSWLHFVASRGIVFPSPLFFMMVYKFVLLFMAGAFNSSIPSGKVLQAMRKLPFPEQMMLIIVVMLRFIPTVVSDFRDVRESMKVRGLLGKFSGLKHPLKTLEFAVVPLIFRSIKVADELAAASMVRGIESPYPKTGYYSDAFTVWDALVLVPSLVLTVFCVLK